MDKNTTFGLDSLSKPTPAFAKNIFYLYFILSKAAIGWLGYTKLMPPTALYETLGFVTLMLDPVVLGLSKMFGCEPSNLQSNETK
jgi:hypothetical protein